MNWYTLFYWVSVADSIKKFFDVASNFCTVFLIISLAVIVVTTIGTAGQMAESRVTSAEEEDRDEDVRAWKSVRGFGMRFTRIFLIWSFITWIGYALTPTKTDALVIIAGGAVGNFVTHDSSTKQIPSEVMTLLRDKIRSEIQDIHINSIPVDTLKTKTKEELIDMIKKK
jgi:hypothetical protein